MNLKGILNGLADTVVKRAPELLVGFGVASLLTAIGLGIKATPLAEDLITQAEDEKGDSLTPVETVKAAGKAYVTTAVAAGVGVLCVASGMKVQSNRHAEEVSKLAAAYALSQSVIKHMDEKNEEILGKEKADEIKKEVKREISKEPEVQKSISKLPASNISGVHPFLDPLSNKAFYANPQMLERAEVKLNKRLFTGLEPYVTASDMYDELNEQGVYPKLRHTAVSSMIGWTADNGGIEFDLDVDGVPMEQDHWEDGTPCYVMSFKRYRAPVSIR